MDGVRISVTKALSHRFAFNVPAILVHNVVGGAELFRPLHSGHRTRRRGGEWDNPKSTNLNESRREKTLHNEKKNPFFSQATKDEREKSGFITAHKC